MNNATTLAEHATAPVQSEAESLPRHLLPWVIWLIATGFVLFQFQLQVCSGPMVDQLMQSFSITAFGAGILSSIYYYVYVIMQVPAGVLIDRYGARLLLGIGSVICTLGCVLFANSTHLIWAQFGRVLMGGGSSFAFVGALYLIGRWFPASRFALLIGMSDMVGSFGSFVGNISLAVGVAAFSWRTSMQFAAMISAILAMLVILVIRDQPSGVVRSTTPLQWAQFRAQIWEVLSNPELWLHGFYIGILFSVVAVFSGLWGIPLIRLQEGISNTAATSLAAVTFLGLGTACPIMGWMYPKIKRPRRMLIASALSSAALVTWMIYFPPPVLWCYGVLMFFLGVASSVYVFNFGLVQDITRPEVRSTACGFLNTLCVVTIPIMQPLIGFILHQSSSHHLQHGTEVYTLANYHIALMVIPISSLLAALIAWMLPKRIHG